MPKTSTLKRKSVQSPDKEGTATQSVSFDWATYDTLERERNNTRIEQLERTMYRSEYLKLALHEKWKRDGVKVERTR